MDIRVIDLVAESEAGSEADSESDRVLPGWGLSSSFTYLSLPYSSTAEDLSAEENQLPDSSTTSRSRSPSTTADGHLSRQLRTSYSHHLFYGVRFSSNMSKNPPLGAFRPHRVESMADDYWPSDDIEETSRLGQDRQRHPSSSPSQLNHTEDYGWTSKESSQCMMAPSDITSSPPRYDETRSFSSTPGNSPGRSKKRPCEFDLTNDPEREYLVPKGPAQDDPVPDNSAAVVETTDKSQTDEAVVDLSNKLNKVGGSFNINTADCMTDDEFDAWLRCAPRERPTNEIEEAVVDDIVYRPSMSLQLRDSSYLRIERICRRGGEYFLYGRHLLATTDSRTEDHIPKVKGELVWMTTSSGPFSIDEVAGHRGIRFTNERTDWNDHEDLVCRLKMTVRLQHDPPVRGRYPLNADERVVEYLAFEESDPGQGWVSTALRDCWRGPGETVPFGAVEVPSAAARQMDEREIIDVEDTSSPSVDLTGLRDRAYTFGDAYSGAGGASCGARQAGLLNAWACDMNKDAVETYRLNFSDTFVYQAEFFHLMSMPEAELRVDIAHCSPPCQPFSPAHTVHNQDNDELNSACVFTGSDLIKRVRPRVLTMEETHGLNERFKPELNRIILNFIQDGYSVRWSVLDCVYYGVPQSRKRLVIIAAGPGETLPEFPQPTNSLPGGGLKPIETIRRAIEHIPRDAPDHDVEERLARWQTLGWRGKYSADQTAKTLTCSGGDKNYHPSGKRSFTSREVACLQTFPLDYKFSHRHVRKQIGNAVPPRFAEAIFREIRRSLRESDEKELQQRESGALRVGM